MCLSVNVTRSIGWPILPYHSENTKIKPWTSKGIKCPTRNWSVSLLAISLYWHLFLYGSSTQKASRQALSSKWNQYSLFFSRSPDSYRATHGLRPSFLSGFWKNQRWRASDKLVPPRCKIIPRTRSETSSTHPCVSYLRNSTDAIFPLFVYTGYRIGGFGPGSSLFVS